MLSINFSTLKFRKVVRKQERTYTLVMLNNQPGVYVLCGGGVSMAGDVWFSARPVLPMGEVYIAGRASHQYWESQIANSWTVPVSAVCQ